VAAAYEQQKKQMGDREYRARHILVEKEDEAKQIIEQLKRGAKFEELAKKSKDTGSRLPTAAISTGPAPMPMSSRSLTRW
jgi:peptidyl-prolyl cis-trans isomerase C